MIAYLFPFSVVFSLLAPNEPPVSSPGDVVCRFEARTKLDVNYYTCTELALKYIITVEKFFLLNPTVDKDCETIKPDTDYCVAGFIQPFIANDGSCGPQHNNASCSGLDKQCCNAETGRCGDQIADCQAGTCFSGPCEGFPSEYSMNGECGYQYNNLKCGGKWGNCCSINGRCGTGDNFCGVSKCQSGNCTIIIPSPPALSTATTSTSKAPLATPLPGEISPDGSCGSTNEYLCKGSSFGNCCSSSGYCGSTNDHCQAGCQTAYGTCTITDLSPDGTCGGTKKYKCPGSGFGDCCSSSGYCGKTTDHCSAGCQPGFGTCSTITTTSKAPVQTCVSTDGSCGGSKGLKCQGSTFGNCCSAAGYCGNSVNHCAQRCQKPFSNGCMTSNISSLDGACGAAKGITCAGGPFNGQCCSSGGFCGTTDSHCRSGCQKNFGTCK